MKTNLITLTFICLFTASGAVAQTATQPDAAGAEGTTAPAVVLPSTKNSDAPVKGENSFTENQAKEKIEDAGFSDVKMQSLDGDGFWHAAAQKDGQPVTVLMDYQGNVTTTNP